MDRICASCRSGGAIVAHVRRRPFGGGGEPAGEGRGDALCRDCFDWIARIVRRAQRGDERMRTIIGSPTIRAGVPEAGECYLCTTALGQSAVAVDCDLAVPSDEWPNLILCPACSAWLGSLIDDSRSLRGNAQRAIDGEYGSFLHPHLAELTIAMEVDDPGAQATIARVCAEAQVAVDASQAALLLVEAGADGRAGRIVTESAGRLRCVVLASLSAEADLRAALAAGARDWLSLPVTPQQLTSALARAMREYSRPLEWDAGTCLPLAYAIPPERPALALQPIPPASPFTVAWLARRFARGYDDLVVFGGEIVLIARAPHGAMATIAARYERILAGRATVTPYAGSARRFEAAG